MASSSSRITGASRESGGRHQQGHWQQGKFLLGRGAFYPNAVIRAMMIPARVSHTTLTCLRPASPTSRLTRRQVRSTSRTCIWPTTVAKLSIRDWWRSVRGRVRGRHRRNDHGEYASLLSKLRPYHQEPLRYMIGTSLDLAKTKIHDLIVEVPIPAGPSEPREWRVHL